jgi:hypothetical protein
MVTLEPFRSDAPEATMTATQHDHGPNFGRKVDGCPRCAELAAGFPARTHPGVEARQRKTANAQLDQDALTAHFASERHRTGGCGLVCTFGDW